MLRAKPPEITIQTPGFLLGLMVFAMPKCLCLWALTGACPLFVMQRSAFSPASLDLLPGELARPPLRLLERGPLPLQRLRPFVATPAKPWLERLRQVVQRAGLA